MSVFQNRDPVDRERIGRAAITLAHSADDAQEAIFEGDWAGFTRADAKAWCWNLFQYEPYGFMYPAKVFRLQRERELEAGEIPENGAYAAKARAYVERGVTPLQYRNAREVLGAKTFCWTDVTYSGSAR